MLENPFLHPPLVESPQSRSWGLGLAFGFQGPPASIPTPTEVEDSDAFQQGVSAGQLAAANGLEIVNNSCIDLNKEPPTLINPEFGAAGFEAITIAKDLLHAHLGAGIISGVFFLVELSIALETHFDDPVEGVRDRAQKIQDLLANMGITDSMELFLGGAIDFDTTGCELKLTPIFRTESNARSAAEAIGRSKLLIVKWRTDQSGGMELVESVGL